MKDKIIIFDTTLRDGEQSPGAALSVYEKVEIAKQLNRLGVDVIEAGFPVSSPEQYEAVERICNEVDTKIAALARGTELDIKTAYNAIKNSPKNRIHTFTSTSDYHILGKFASEKYGVALEEKRKTILKMTYDAVAYAKTFCEDVEYSAEDAGRTDINYLIEIVETAIMAGATTINIPDTTGYTFPNEYGKIISTLKQKVKGIENIILSIHCHNDLGLAVANSLFAVENGARQVECTINGIGERAGNASLEEFVMALNVRKDLCNYYTDIKTTELYNTSKMVSAYTGIIVQPNKAIIGENAFSHESGIHQDGMLKNRNTYEIMTPETVGVKNTKIVLGRHSGRHGLLARLKELGYSVNDTELLVIYEKFIKLSDKKKEIYDEDLRTLMGESITNINDFFRLDYLNVNSGTNTVPSATLKILANDTIIVESAVGDGPVDAVFNAIERALEIKSSVESYTVRSITAGRQALGESILRVKINDKAFVGKGISTDVVEASAKAYINALNQAYKNKTLIYTENENLLKDEKV